jgi:hypothetical protein
MLERNTKDALVFLSSDYPCSYYLHHNVNYSPKDPKSKAITNAYHYYVFDDKEHDTLFVQYCFELHW